MKIHRIPMVSKVLKTLKTLILQLNNFKIHMRSLFNFFKNPLKGTKSKPTFQLPLTLRNILRKQLLWYSVCVRGIVAIMIETVGQQKLRIDSGSDRHSKYGCVYT